MNGPFKAFLTAVSIRSDLEKGTREARFSFCVLAEPRWNGFQYQSPALVAAADGAGKTYSVVKNQARGEHWNKGRASVLDFGDDWSAVKVPGLARTTRSFSALSIEIPVRIIHSKQECRLPMPVSEPSTTKIEDGKVFTLRDCKINRRGIRATLNIKGQGLSSWVNYEFSVEQAGKKIGTLHMRSSTASGSRLEFELMGSLGRGQPQGGPRTFVISYPKTTTTKKFRFNFRDLELPFPTTNL